MAPAEVSSTLQPGWYAATMTQAGTNGDQLLIGGKELDGKRRRRGRRDLPQPANFTNLSITSGGAAAVQAAFKKNAAIAGLPVQMTDSTTHAPVTGRP